MTEACKTCNGTGHVVCKRDNAVVVACVACLGTGLTLRPTTLLDCEESAGPEAMLCAPLKRVA